MINFLLLIQNFFLFSILLTNLLAAADCKLLSKASCDSAISLASADAVDSFPGYFGKDFLGDFSPMDWIIHKFSWAEPNEITLDVLKEQFRRDVIIWYATLMKPLPENHKIAEKILTTKHVERFHHTQDFLKRWVLLMAACPLMYVSKDNASSMPFDHVDYQDLKPFPFPLASALSHGQRMLLQLFDVPCEYLYNLLLSGDHRTEPMIDYKRRFASHRVYEQGGKLFEDKICAGVGDDHIGVNIPLGGVGNTNEMGLMIGPEGQSYVGGSAKSVSKLQLGHVYIRRDRFESSSKLKHITISSLLMGVESTAPFSRTPFRSKSKSHTITSGMQDQTQARSVTGSKKWALLLSGLAPAEYGGMVIIITPNQFEVVKKLFVMVLSLPEAEQEMFFKELLSCNAQEAHDFLMHHPRLQDIHIPPYFLGSNLLCCVMEGKKDLLKCERDLLKR